MVIWIAGPPGSGKTTLAVQVCKALRGAVVLDGDDVRTWLTPDCDFSPEGRTRHAARVGRVARAVSEAGGTAIVALVRSPVYPVNLLIYLQGPARKPLWPGTSYAPPERPDLTVRSDGSKELDEAVAAILRAVEA